MFRKYSIFFIIDKKCLSGRMQWLRWPHRLEISRNLSVRLPQDAPPLTDDCVAFIRVLPCFLVVVGSVFIRLLFLVYEAEILVRLATGLESKNGIEY